MVDFYKKQNKSTQLNDGDRKVLYIYADHYPERVGLVQYSDEYNTLNNTESEADNQKEVLFNESKEK